MCNTLKDKLDATCTTNSRIIDNTDFIAEFKEGRWIVKWKWKSPPHDVPKKGYCSAREKDRKAFDEEIQGWINEGILIRYDQELHGELKVFLPVFGVRQEKGDTVKVRPVFDFRKFNEHVESHPGDGLPVCSDRLRQWRQIGPNITIVDLRKAYLQVHVDESLWTYQAITWHGEVYLLTRMGFGLTSAPKIMTSIVETVLSFDSSVKEAVSSYIDDLMVDTSKISIDQVVKHLTRWGLSTKSPEPIGVGQSVRVLGLRVDTNFCWSRDGLLPNSPGENTDILTRRKVHKIIGELMGHFPILSWLRVHCAFIQRCSSDDKVDWDEPVSSETAEYLREILNRIEKEGDPARGRWIVSPVAP